VSDDRPTRALRLRPSPAASRRASRSSDGTRLASASFDRTLRLDPRSGTPLGRPFTGHTGRLTALAVSPDGHRVVTASEDRTARIWNVDFHDWVSAGCAIVQRNLSADEWQQYLERTCPGLP
jgi:WD40 repeat protein